MIGTVDVAVQALNPSMPLYPMRAFVSSPTSIRVRNVPKRIGKWAIESVQFVAAYPDSSIKTANCVLTGGVWVGTIEGTSTSGTSKNGYTIFASGTDENGEPVTGYVLGKGDIEILEADGTLNPDAPSYYVHFYPPNTERPTKYNIGDSEFLNGVYSIYDGEEWRRCKPDTIPAYITDSNGNAISADRSCVDVIPLAETVWHIEADITTPFVSHYEGDATYSNDQWSYTDPFGSTIYVGRTVNQHYEINGWRVYGTMTFANPQTQFAIQIIVDFSVDGDKFTESIVHDNITLTRTVKTDTKLATVSQLPTKTSDLTNDSGFITAAQVPTPSYIEDSDGNKIEADRDFTQVDFATSWVVDDGVSEHYLSGSKDNATEQPPENPQDGAVRYYLGYGGMHPDMWNLTVMTYSAATEQWNMTIETSDASEEATELEFANGITATWQKATTTTGKLATEEQVAQKQDQLSEAQMMAIDLDAEALYTQVVVDSEWEPRKFIAASDTLTKQDFADAGLFDMTNNVWLHIPKGVQTGSNVTTIDTNLFNGCTQLQTFIGPNVNELKSQVFNGCTALATVTLPNLRRVGISGFRDCTSLTSLVIPPSIVFVGRNAFTGCAHITVHFEEKTLAEVQGMGNYPWGLTSNQFTADKTATQNWVTSNYTNSSDLTSLLAAKRGVTDMDVRGLPEGVVGWFVVDGTKVVNIGPNEWNGGDIYISRQGENQYELEYQMEITSFTLDSSFTSTVNGHSIVGYASEIASQAWVEGNEYATRAWVSQNYLASVPVTYKTYIDTVQDLANDGYATTSQLGNGTITLTQGGVTKGTFTTNQSANATIDLDAGGGGGSGYTVNFFLRELRGMNYDGPTSIKINGQVLYTSTLIQQLFGDTTDSSCQFAVANATTFQVGRSANDNSISMNGQPCGFGEVTLTGDALVVVTYETCLSPDTLILMSDGTAKMIADTKVGDMIMTPFGADTVTKVSHGEGEATDVWTFDDDTIVKTIGRHRFYNCELGEPMYLEAWKIGEHALTPDGNKVALVSHVKEVKPSPHWTIFTAKYNLYYANGLLAGNRHSCGYDNL